jgi:hypothetical protein
LLVTVGELVGLDVAVEVLEGEYSRQNFQYLGRGADALLLGGPE